MDCNVIVDQSDGNCLASVKQLYMVLSIVYCFVNVVKLFWSQQALSYVLIFFFSNLMTAKWTEI